MPFVKRDTNQQIIAVFRQKQVNASEEISASSPELIHFLFTDPEENSFDKRMLFMELSQLRLSDLSMIRVLEDLINLLADKGVININEFPEGAVKHLKARQAMRLRLETITRVLSKKNSSNNQ